MTTTTTANTKPTVRELNIEPEKLQKVNELLGDGEKSHYYRKTAIRNILGHTFCTCGEIPFYEISYTDHEITRIEHWCRNCWSQTQARAKEEPELRTREELAAFYGCAVAPDGTFGRAKK